MIPIKSYSRHSAGDRGVTIVELAVVLAIFAVATTFIYGIFVSQLRSRSWQAELLDTEQNIRGALDLMEAEMRRTEFVNSVTGPCVETGSESGYCTGISVMASGGEAGGREFITYYLGQSPSGEAEANLMRSSRREDSDESASALVAENITGLEITCYDQTGMDMPHIQPGDLNYIKKAKIAVTGATGTPNPNTGQRAERTVAKTVDFRNSRRYQGSAAPDINSLPGSAEFVNPEAPGAESP